MRLHFNSHGLQAATRHAEERELRVITAAEDQEKINAEWIDGR